VLDARQGNMRDVTSYSRVRIALLGLVRAIFGLLVLGLGMLAIWEVASGDSGPWQWDSLSQWGMMLGGAGLAFFGFVLATGGLGRLVSAFAGGCYIKAGPEGLALRFPMLGWFGIFKVVEYQFKWEEIESIFPVTNTINLIPTTRELHIRLFGGKDIEIVRSCFSASSKKLCAALLKISKQAGH
jgi:hypothetical protein